MLKTIVFEELKRAMKEKDVLSKGVLTLLKAALEKAEKEKGSTLTTEEEIAVVNREVKKTLQTVFNEALQTEKKLLEIKKVRAEIEEQFDKAPLILKTAKPLNLSPDCLDKWDNEYNALDKVGETRQQLASILLALTANEGGIYPKLEHISHIPNLPNF